MIYLDNAATSYPKPESVKNEVMKCMTVFGGNPGRGSHRLAMLASEKIYDCRCKLCDFFSYDTPENVIFTYNATYALNIAIKSSLKEQCHVLISDVEHNSVYRPIYKLAQHGQCRFDVFPTSGDVISDLGKLINEKTKMLICSHISNVSGRILPVKEIGKLCKQKNITFILDASQSTGHTDVSIKDIKCDVLCAPGHKGLLGIQGCGFAIFKERSHLQTVIEGGSGVNSASPEMPSMMPEALEAGTLATPAIASVGAGVDFIRDVGINEISEREHTLRYFLIDRLLSLKGVTVQDVDKNCSSAVSFFINERDSDEICTKLDDSGICVRSGLHCSPLAHKTLKSPPGGTVRASVGYFNTIKDIDSFSYTLKDIIKNK